jgi:hypothetical protein
MHEKEHVLFRVILLSDEPRMNIQRELTSMFMQGC